MRKMKNLMRKLSVLVLAGALLLSNVLPTYAADASGTGAEGAGDEVYVLMNVPYNDFYQAELSNNEVKVDAVSSATLNKPRTGTLVGGSYHVNSDGSDITGVTIPVKLGDDVTLDDLVSYKEVTDESSVTISVTNRGQTSETVYSGKDALFESDSYSYYVLSEAPSYYKVVTKDTDGKLVFGKMQGEATTLENVEATLLTTSNYGDYQLNLTGMAMYDDLYGVVIEAKDADGNVTDYGLRHLENIWRTTNLAWCTGFTTNVHSSPTSSAHYESMMGKTITKITYYTGEGIFEIPVSDTYVPVKFAGASLQVEDALASDGSTSVTLTGLPEGYEPEYTVEGVDDASVSDGTLTFSKDAKAGIYTLQVSDKNGKYAGISASFTIYADSLPVVFDQGESKLRAAEGFSEADLTGYVKNITSVEVNGTSYAASGRGAVTIINEDGTLKTDAAPFAQEDKIYTVTVKATGYKQDLTFNYGKGYTYVYAGLTWAEYWESEGVYLSGTDLSASSNVKDSKGESDKGAFDAVSRATVNHGLHRGSFQCTTTIHAVSASGEEKDFAVSTWEDNGASLVLTDGTKVSYSRGVIKDGETEYTLSSYEVDGIKYVPVAVKTSDYEEFKNSYSVVENGGELVGGFSEQNLSAYRAAADVTADTNGLKTAVKNEDGTFSFSTRIIGSGSGLADSALKKAKDVNVEVQAANGSYGEFLRVYLTGAGYGGLASGMYAVRWTYYGSDESRTNALVSYGTKFASDNWLHKSMGIQLGLTDSLRCQLPEGTDGTGYWALTVYAMGYSDYTAEFEVTSDNIVKTKDEETIDTSELEKLIAEAEQLTESDYTAASWKSVANELAEAKEELTAKKSQAAVDEAYTHLKDAIDALVKAQGSTGGSLGGTTGGSTGGTTGGSTGGTTGGSTGGTTGGSTGGTTGGNTGNDVSTVVSTVKSGKTYTKGNLIYKVTSTKEGSRTVAVVSVKSQKLTSATIPATVKISGQSYKVTKIAKNAFEKCTKLKKVTIGKNVLTIGASAFSGDSALKTITIESKVLKTVGSGAFKGISSNAKIKVPSSKLKAYKSLLKGKGQGKKVTITK